MLPYLADLDLILFVYLGGLVGLLFFGVVHFDFYFFWGEFVGGYCFCQGFYYVFVVLHWNVEDYGKDVGSSLDNLHLQGIIQIKLYNLRRPLQP